MIAAGRRRAWCVAPQCAAVRTMAKLEHKDAAEIMPLNKAVPCRPPHARAKRRVTVANYSRKQPPMPRA